MKTRDPQWYDLFQQRGTRRDFLRLGGSVAGLIALGSLPACGTERRRFPTLNGPFGLGVASGDPLHDSVVLWTRLTPTLDEAVGLGPDALAVDWEVAEDEAFSRVVASGTGSARPELGHSVHAEAQGLRSGREYFYRWIANGEASPVGRTKTAPAPDASPDEFRFAFASCQHYEHGHYTAYHHMAQEQLDLIVHLGDYIYESSWGTPIRHHEGPEIHTLEDYRGRYTTYRSEPNLMAAHASAPWVVTWDDHEVDNNWANMWAEDDQTTEELMLRRAAAFQAYYEFMPLRPSSMPTGPDMQIYRALRFGDLLDMTVLDTRQYRDDQACGDGTKPTCPGHQDEQRTVLGGTQRDWLFERVGSQQTTWNVLAQQIMVARLRGTNSDDDEVWSMDVWDGYPAERRRLLNRLSEVANPVVLTGDIHSNWVSDLHTDFDDLTSPIVATELTGTSISSGGNGQDMTNGGESVLSQNPHIKFYNGQRGYVSSTVTPESWTARYEVVPVITEPDAPKHTRATYVIEAGQPGAQEA